MTILMDNRREDAFPQALEQVMNRMILDTLAYEAFEGEGEISVSIVDNEEIRQINKQFRGIDRATDVLSFPLMTFAEGETPDCNEKGEILLGDIVLSLEQAEEQAKEYGHSLTREVAFLTAHSMLHLLGYDHMEEEGEKEMFFKQEEILQKAGISRT